MTACETLEGGESDMTQKSTKDVIQIYTDGSCLKNPYGPGGYAAIIRYQSNGKQYEMRLSGGAAGTTNNRMELMAVIEAVKHCPDIEKPMLYIRIHSISWMHLEKDGSKTGSDSTGIEEKRADRSKMQTCGKNY